MFILSYLHHIPPLHRVLKNGRNESEFCKKDLKCLMYCGFEPYMLSANWKEVGDLAYKVADVLRSYIPYFEKELDNLVRKQNMTVKYNWHSILAFYGKLVSVLMAECLKVKPKGRSVNSEAPMFSREDIFESFLNSFGECEVTYTEELVGKVFKEVFSSEYYSDGVVNLDNVEENVLLSLMPSEAVIWKQYLRIKENNELFEISSLYICFI